MQRIFDIVLASLAILVLSPLLIPIALLLRFTGEGEIFYIQMRVGLRGKLFGLYKFATMLKDSPNIGTGTVTTKSDPRILPVGRVLRYTKLNELPQLVNIVFGDMSIIGPRPRTPRGFEAVPEKYKEVLASVRPGLSGIGSIIFRDEESLLNGNHQDPVEIHDKLFTPYKGELENWYVQRAGIKIYILLILITVWVVLNPNSRVVWEIFADLPAPSEELGKLLEYPFSTP